MYVILMYDINADEKSASVQRKIFKTCKRYLTHVQFSVFEGEISDAQLFALKTEIDRCIRKNMDSIVIFKSRNEKWLAKEVIGKNTNEDTNFI